ncbi:protein phosphatase methylesterase 1-like isoform X1 [Amphibalanus amphitrite]|nr:protein phosphatase methylesterase 1-like isoform X1 [Amphibalanus amphitrite]XP_043190700.1 protein phosphatase methylesterase 1-like isoform X1 [Amphibalanus amphitrite]XP_043190716.1 protein phosphatase methylesterase 1-like isoform X1 [Amphibalanus amphitrite]XP_043190724.1 protein phosphatase methylesterase 1-like isoform X1 [Amphibalanus amphitrite]XP_043190732.1 protein phosphatase methylesterase 1-like isoform X1 [Amphibalanus amphitrite]XP_043190740.1 protein phosphatase methyleste
MSSLQKQLQKMKCPTLPPVGPSSSRSRRQARDLTPATWQRYFASAQEVRLESGDVFHVYRAGSAGPLLVLLHGGGYSGLTWSLFTEEIMSRVECQVLAIDLRGHGETATADEHDLSMERLVSDVNGVMCALFGSDAPPTVLVGHSMGGALAVHTAHAWSAGPLVGLVVIDVVEGTALDALSAMHTFLRGRPDHFRSVQNAIEWCLKSGAVRNSESARVSVPGQLKNLRTGVPATRDIASGLASAGGGSPTAGGAHPPADTIAEEEEGQEKDQESAEQQTVAHSPPSPTADQPVYTWRIDLASTEPHWQGWFRGLSPLFLSAPAPKVLLLAGIDRLDRELSVGQMQGKFQIQVVPRSGHVVHEDVPDRVAGIVATFLIRQRLTHALDGFQTIPPGC